LGLIQGFVFVPEVVGLEVSFSSWLAAAVAVRAMTIYVTRTCREGKGKEEHSTAQHSTAQHSSANQRKAKFRKTEQGKVEQNNGSSDMA
jgi:hypothetical protein